MQIDGVYNDMQIFISAIYFEFAYQYKASLEREEQSKYKWLSTSQFFQLVIDIAKDQLIYIINGNTQYQYIIQYKQQHKNMQQQNPYTNYISYLQQLLKTHNIAHKTLQQYNSPPPPSGSVSQSQNNRQFMSGPLQTNLHKQLHSDQLLRYSRQMLLRQIGYQGQLKICSAKVAVIGAGGIGCPLAMYLVGAGIGTLGIYDSDKVQMSNLHRQIGHRTSRLNTPKTSSLTSTLHSINPSTVIHQHPFITPQTAHTLQSYDIVIDGSDNPKCRYIVNDYLMSQNKGLLSGACVGWQGQITYYGNGSPCYRCIWGDNQVSVGNCATIGVVGMLPGFVAMILGVQALKLIVNGKSSLEGSLLTYQAKSCTFRKIKLRNKKQQCAACGTADKRLDISKYNYAAYDVCGTVGQPPQVLNNIQWEQMIQIIKQNQDKDKNKKHIHLDVRPSAQYNIQHILNSINIPYQQLKTLTKQQICHKLGIQKEGQNNGDATVYVSCKSGIMSRFATNKLKELGIDDAYNVVGGINLYGKLYDPNIANI